MTGVLCTNDFHVPFGALLSPYSTRGAYPDHHQAQMLILVSQQIPSFLTHL